MEFDESVIVKRSDDPKLLAEAELEHLMSLHCAKCNTILADSLGVCGEVKCIDSIMCTRVSDDVAVSDSLELVRKGEMANCVCSFLKCRSCNVVVGKVIHAAPPHLAVIRSIFLLYKGKLSCYILGGSSVVKASSLSFDMKPLSETISEARQELEEQLGLMTLTFGRLADMSMNSQSTTQSS
ncbi:protein Mis18-beta isoform 1-T1 [Fundulus diaphanus]